MTPPKSDTRATPRTDEFENSRLLGIPETATFPELIAHVGQDIDKIFDFARTLERELSLANERLQGLEELRPLSEKATGGLWKMSSYRPEQLLQRDPAESTYKHGDDHWPAIAKFNEWHDTALVAAAINWLRKALREREVK